MVRGTLSVGRQNFPAVLDAYASHGRGVPPNEVAVRKAGPIYGGPPMGDAWGGVRDRSRYALPASLNSNICTLGNPMQSPTKDIGLAPVPAEPMMQDNAFTRAHSPFRLRFEELREQHRYGEVARTFEPGLEQQLKARAIPIETLGSGPGSSRLSFFQGPL